MLVNSYNYNIFFQGGEMKQIIIIVLLMIGVMNMSAEDKYRDLTDFEKFVIEEKGTERAFTGEYTDYFEDGTYNCKKCGTELFRSNAKFHSGCGWPSFDDAIKGRVKELLDADGRRTEIVCANCGAHLGHVFRGEGFTDKNTRHCVNSVSLTFDPIIDVKEYRATETAIFAGGCFWGVEYHLNKLDGVISTTVGYTGGNLTNPEYYDVTTGTTGHAEAIEVVFDPSKVTYEDVAKLFFEIHDPTQKNRQGPDIGHQYRSAVYYRNFEQKKTIDKLIGILEAKGLDVKTEVEPATTFYPAEDYHQDYYDKKGSLPYCHSYTKRFD
jgi:peptide methionine sulfoxide reductase msrA/msrB